MRMSPQGMKQCLGIGLVLAGVLWIPQMAGAAAMVSAKETMELGEPGSIRKVVCNFTDTSLRVVAGPNAQSAPVLIKQAVGSTQAEAQKNAQALDVSVETQDDVLTLGAHGLGKGQGKEPPLVLQVPKGTIFEIDDRNADITCLGPLQNVKIASARGQLVVKGASGNLTIEHVDGPVDIDADNVLVNASTSEGRMTYRGFPAPGEHHFGTSKQPLVLMLSKKSQFEVKASTRNAHITNEFGMRIITRDGTSLHAVCGKQSDMVLNLENFDADIVVKKLK